MANELAFVLINPHSLSKSRTGGVMARYLARTEDLKFVGARMFNPPIELVERYATLVRGQESKRSRSDNLIADYILKSYGPNPVTGKLHRVMMLLFEGEDAVAKIWKVTGSSTLRDECGETVRETYGEFISDEEGIVRYFEPAVLVSPSSEKVMRTLKLWAKYSTDYGGIVQPSSPYGEGEIERTLVLLKPDNFRYPSLRPGSIIDVLSISGLRIVGAKKFRMTVAQAEEFYGPVKAVLSKKFVQIGSKRAARALAAEFGFDVPVEDVQGVCENLGDRFAANQFENIVKFMTGHKPSEVGKAKKSTSGTEECLALVYEGVDAVGKIRNILGPTDPHKAQPGSVRREFGSNIMVNAAHASDSPENARREMAIINVEEDTISSLIHHHHKHISLPPHVATAWSESLRPTEIWKNLKSGFKSLLGSK